MGGQVQRPSDERRFKSGHYGAGTLWYHSTREGIFIAFNGVRIAKRGRDAETWAAVEGGWKVTPVGRAELQIQHDENDGVLASLYGGGK
jgi:hypothetical protein